MAFDDLFRLSAHAVITNEDGEVLLLKANYGDSSWGLPGGALEPGETIHEALLRECLEELSCDVDVSYLSGVYYHSAYNSQAFIFRCTLEPSATIKLSSEHTDYMFTPIEHMSPIQQHRVRECLEYSGSTVSARF